MSLDIQCNEHVGSRGHTGLWIRIPVLRIREGNTHAQLRSLLRTKSAWRKSCKRSWHSLTIMHHHQLYPIFPTVLRVWAWVLDARVSTSHRRSRTNAVLSVPFPKKILHLSTLALESHWGAGRKWRQRNVKSKTTFKREECSSLPFWRAAPLPSITHAARSE